MDPWDHPDLVHLDRLLQSRLEETLQAEQYAARLAFQRRQSLRDRLLDLEDQAGRVAIQTVTGSALRGEVVAVGTDHAVVRRGRSRQIVSLQHIVSITTDSDG